MNFFSVSLVEKKRVFILFCRVRSKALKGRRRKKKEERALEAANCFKRNNNKKKLNY